MRTLVWFRDDLRLDDHLALLGAVEAGHEVGLLAVVDTQQTGTATGYVPGIELPRLGPARAQFWMESLEDLRRDVRARGSELFVRVGRSEDVVPAFAEAMEAREVWVQAHAAHEEVQTERTVARRLEADGRKLRRTPGRTLIHEADLPYPVPQLPNTFTSFRKAVEAESIIRKPKPAPETLPPFPRDFDPGAIPTLASFGLSPLETELLPGQRVMDFRGGAAAGRARLEAWTFDAGALGTYKDTRNGLLEADESSKLSPWLAHGCLSPRRISEVVERYEEARGANESTYWLIFELLWRDYFQFLARREGARLFLRTGVGRRTVPGHPDRARFDAWCEGRTGYPFVDAFMRELRSTGFMSNRGRQNVASFLAKSLEVDWRWGAAWFEAHLVDYDPASNWGNWQYAAGVGTDPRDRVFNVVKQAFDYDPDGTFVRRWIPELDRDGSDIHTPWCFPGETYPAPLVAAPESLRSGVPRGRKGQRARRSRSS